MLEERRVLNADVVFDLDLLSDGNDGVADTIIARLDANDANRLHLEVNGHLISTESVENVESVTINGSSDSDTLVVDAVNGLPMFQINYNAGQGVEDALEMIGLPAGANTTYATLPPTQDGKSGINTVTAGDTTLEVHFTGIEPQVFVGAGGTLTLDATSTPATSMLTLSDSGVFNDGVNIVTGDGGFEDTTFSGFGSLVVLGGDGAETITFEGLDDADPDGGGPGVALTNITLDGDNTGGTDVAADTINLQALAASMTATIRGGGGSDTITLNTIANSIGGLLGNVIVDGEDHAAGSTTLTISVVSNTLDTGDILNLNDASDAGNFTYTLDATTFTRSGIGTITYNAIETFNLTTSLGSGGPTVVDVNNTAAGVNTNITTQNVTGQPSDINVTTTGADSNVIINTSTANDDINIADTGGDGPDAGFLQGSFTRINTSGGNDIFTQQNAAQNSFIEVNLEAGTDTANVHAARNAALTDINAGDNTDTLNWGNPSNTLTGYAGILQFDGGNHDAGSSSLTIKGETNTLDSGDIVNLNDQGETAETGYQFQEFGSSILAREGAGGLTYTNTETFNVNTTSGVANFIGFGSAPGININYTSQDAADTFQFFDGDGIGADVNFVIDSAGGADDFDIDEGGGNGTAGNAGFGAFVQINAGNDNDTFTIDDIAANDRFELIGEGGEDTFNVTPSLGLINVVGGTPAFPSTPGDTLNLTQPAGETTTLLNQTIDSGTYQTTGGFADVMYDEIESGPPPVPVETEITLVGGTLTVRDVNGGVSNDNLQVFLLGTDYQFTEFNGNIIDASSIPGATGSGTNMVSVPAAGVTGIDVRTFDGDDMVVWLNLAAVDYSVGGVMIDGGTGEDTMSFSGSFPVNMGNADLTVTATKTASVSGAGPFSFVNGNLTVEGNVAGTFAGSTAGTAAALGATVNITGTGSVTVTGRGGAMGGAGVLFQGRVTSTATGPTAGTITLDGIAGGTTAGSPGVTLTNASAFITSVDGDIMITGIGTSGGDGNYGIEINDVDRIESTGTGADAATIMLHGTAGNGGFDNSGLRIFNAAITSALGEISLTGIGGTVDPTSFASTGVSVIRSTVQVDAGSLQIDGTSNGGIAAGVWMLEGEIASIGNGTVEITAAANALGPDFKSQNVNNVIGGPTSNSPFTINADSIDWANLEFQSTGDLVIKPRTASTTIGLGGGMGDLNLDDTELGFLADGFNSITIGDTATGTGNVDIDTVTFTDPVTIAGGTINDAIGTDIAAGTNSVTLEGNVAPGQSPGILTVTGNFAFATGATYEAEIMGTIPGAQHDQIAVTGTVNINNATLNILDTGYAAVGNETFVLINNDGTDAVTGTFNGLADGTLVTVGGTQFRIVYDGGDGNDVALTPFSPVGPARFDLDGATPFTQAAFTSIDTTNIYPVSQGYGWMTAAGTFDRGSIPGATFSDLLRDGHFGMDNTFLADLVDGNYVVNVTLGDQFFGRDMMDVYAEGALILNDLSTATGEFVHRSFPVSVTGNRLELRFDDDGGDPSFVVNAIEILTTQQTHTLTPNATGATVSGGGATPNQLVTVDTTLGTIVSVDAAPEYAGVQVLSNASGNFSFEIMQDPAGGNATISSEEVTGVGIGSTTFAYPALPIVSVSVSPTAVDEDGTTLLAYTFSRGAATTGNLTVNFNVGGDATLAVDYATNGADTFLAASGTVTIPSGQPSVDVLIDPTADTMVEPDETITITVTAHPTYVVGTPNSATGTITNDDSDTEVTLNSGVLTITDIDGGNSNDNLVLSYSGGTYTLNDTGGLLIDASSIAGSTGSVTTTVTIPDTGVTGIEFDTLSGDDNMTVDSVQPNLISSFTVNDGSGEDTFTLNGNIDTSAGTGGTSISVSRNISLNAGAVIASGDGDIDLTANVAGGSTGTFAAVSLDDASILSAGNGNITINGTASGLDDVVTIGSSTIDAGPAGNLLFNADTVMLSLGSTVAGQGQLFLTPRTAATTIGLGGGTGTLNLDDAELSVLQDGFQSITIGDTAAGSGTVDIDTATFNDPITIAGGTINDRSGNDILAGTDTVTLVGNVAPGQSPGILIVVGDVEFADGSSYEVEMAGTTPGEGANDHDQVSASGAVHIGLNVGLSVSGLLSFVPSAGDGFVIVERNGGTGNFQGLPEGAVVDSNFLGSNLPAFITYSGGDGDDVEILMPPVYDFTQSDFSVAELDAPHTTNVVMVTRSRTTLASSVDVALTGVSATEGVDFSAGPVGLNFPVGVATLPVPIEILGDTFVEPNETILLTFSNSLIAGTTNPTSTLTIDDDDSATISIDDVTKVEGGDFEFTITLSEPVTVPITLQADTSDGSANNSDYVPLIAEPLTFAVGVQTQTVSVLSTNDFDFETDETFFVDLSNLVTDGADVTFSDSQGLGTIIEPPPMIAIDDISMPEGDGPTKTFLIPVRLNEPLSSNLIVDYVVSPDSAIPPEDYLTLSGNFTIPAGITEFEFPITVVGDNRPEADETFVVDVTFLTSDDDVAAFDSQSFVTIENDDLLKVVGVKAGSTDWSPAFKEHIDPTGADFGYPIPTGPGQLSPLPWANIDQLQLEFNADISSSFDENLFGLAGYHTSNYAAHILSTVYDQSEFTVTITLDTFLGDDQLLLVASDLLTNVTGDALDGEWVTGQSSNVSGNGAGGGDFEFRFDVLPGDVNQSGTLSSNDGFAALRLQSLDTSSANYFAFADIDGSAEISSNDGFFALARQGTERPKGTPTAPPLPRAAQVDLAIAVLANSERDDELTIDGKPLDDLLDDLIRGR